jgi:hypothetical protein
MLAVVSSALAGREAMPSSGEQNAGIGLGRPPFDPR